MFAFMIAQAHCVKTKHVHLKRNMVSREVHSLQSKVIAVVCGVEGKYVSVQQESTL